MSSTAMINTDLEIIYPERDGRPMADNTRQYEWIVLIKEGLDSLLQDFVAADIFWYPVEGNPRIVQAPDVMVALGRPKGHRSSYKQWQEDNIAPRVVFEILSPGNTLPEMFNKQRFYQRYGVEEYYVYNPDSNEMWGYFGQERWQEIDNFNGWVSPLLNIRFELTSDNLIIYRPDGKRFLSFFELEQQNQQLEQQNQQLEQQNQQLEQQNQQLAQEKENLSAKAERLVVRLKELGIDPEQV